MRRTTSTEMRDGPVAAGGSGSVKRRPTSSPLRLTAMMTSAPSARQTETGTGLERPPSSSHLPSRRAGLKMPGNAIEARTASWIGPGLQPDLAAGGQSVATAAYCVA